MKPKKPSTRILPTKRQHPLIVIVLLVSTMMMIISSKNTYFEWGFGWMWFLLIGVFPVACLLELVHYYLRIGEIEIGPQGIVVKNFQVKKWTFSWDQIEGFGEKRILFWNYPTVRPKPLLIPKDEIVIRHQYQASSTKIAEILNHSLQRTLEEREAHGA